MFTVLVALWVVVNCVVVNCAVAGATTLAASAPGGLLMASLTQRGQTFAKVAVALSLVGASCLLLGWRKPRRNAEEPTDQHKRRSSR